MFETVERNITHLLRSGKPMEFYRYPSYVDTEIYRAAPEKFPAELRKVIEKWRDWVSEKKLMDNKITLVFESTLSIGFKDGDYIIGIGGHNRDGINPTKFD